LKKSKNELNLFAMKQNELVANFAAIGDGKKSKIKQKKDEG